ncbi:endonuclease/exonuclease/phosphatase family protein [Roseovarius sp. SYSU LYC5161]|uniref:endonuclease/exonuclease/phosphatase family protein n=1 Tax=Roseovarius halophilus (ex Wu et al. 2025) TaxID=3376060 RepID=UPI003999C8AC
MRIATYNVEWFNALFDVDGNLLDDGEKSARHDVTRSDQLAALGIVLTAIDADAVMIIEAPDPGGKSATVLALENFARVMQLRARRAVVGFENGTQQEIALLYDPDALRVRHDPQGALSAGGDGHGDVPRFDRQFRIDLDIDAKKDSITFSKPPFELAAETASGFRFRMIGAHLKSKAPHGAETRDQIMRMAISNRRKQQAQAVWLRQRVEAHLEAGDPLILLGDLNDGPGLDEYEDLFGRSSVEIIMGADAPALLRLHDPHAHDAVKQRIGPLRATARFYLTSERRYLQALLDYIMISPDLMARDPRWRIWHPFDDPGCWRYPELRDALLDASDHFPVTLDIDI